MGQPGTGRPPAAAGPTAAAAEAAAAAVWPRDIATLSCDDIVVESLSKELRELCGRPRSSTAAECVAASEALDSDIATQVVQRANRNGKTPLHFAAQNRRSGDCVLVCEALLQRGALVNATTDRGHTPLIYAAGRGRDEAVALLLAHGANPRVICVTGHTAAQMAVGHVWDDCVELLEAAEQSSDQEWLDFRKDPAAVEAHMEHCKSCPSCRLMASPQTLLKSGQSSTQLADAEIAASVRAAVDELLQITEAVAKVTGAVAHRDGEDAAERVVSLSKALVESQAVAERLEEKRTGKPRTTRPVNAQKKKKVPQHAFKICLAPLPAGAPHRLKLPPPAAVISP